MHLNESNLRDPSTTSPVFHSTLVAAENHNVYRRPRPIQPIGSLPIAGRGRTSQLEKLMTDDTKHNEAVGYQHPPVATQFKPGVSGNPSGRPKTVRSLRAEVLDELRQLVRFREGDSEVEISKARAIAKSLVHAAAGGNLRATTALLAFFIKSLGDTDEPQSHEVTPEDAEIINAYESRELRRRSNACDIDADNSPTTSHEERKADNA